MRANGDKSLRNKHAANVGEERGREMHLEETHQMFLNAKKKPRSESLHRRINTSDSRWTR